jgi:TetR/AcrR family transcriptional regulator
MSNREKLLACALDLFTNRGYDAVGVQEIVDGVGIKKPTLYYYFGSKRGLLEAIFSEYFESFLAQVQEAAHYQHDVAGTLRGVTLTYFSFAAQQPRLYRFYLSMWFAPVESEAFKVSTVLNQRQQLMLEALFEAAATDHGNMKGRHQRYAASFLGMINTYIMLGLNGYSALDDSVARSMVHQFMHGIFS